jgi:hypothetical protein
LKICGHTTLSDYWQQKQILQELAEVLLQVEDNSKGYLGFGL